MSDEIWPKIIDSLHKFITAVGVILSGWFAYKSQRQSKTNEKKIDVIGENVDGKMDKLLEAREDAAFKSGKLDERDAERVHLEKDKQE